MQTDSSKQFQRLPAGFAHLLVPATVLYAFNQIRFVMAGIPN